MAAAPYTLDWTFGRVVGVVSLGVALAALGIALLRRPRWLEPLLVATVLSPFLYAASTYTYYVAEPRYLVSMAPLPALFVARLLTRPAVAAVVLAAAVGFSVYGLSRIDEQGAFVPLAAKEVRMPPVIGPLI